MKKSDQRQFNRVLVTGASSGIGRALCRLLADQKIDLMIAGRNEVSLNALAEELRQKVDIHAFIGDLAVQEDRKLLIDNIYHYVPDLIVNNAGAGLYGDALTYETAQQMKIFSVNAEAVAEITLEGARALYSAGKPGVILNVSSVAAFQVFPGLAMYASAKSFVNQFSCALDEEMKPYGIRILTACPGVVETGFRKSASGRYDSEYEGVTMSAEYAAQEIWNQVLKAQQLKTFDWHYRLLRGLLCMIPQSLIRSIAHRIILKRTDRRNILSR